MTVYFSSSKKDGESHTSERNRKSSERENESLDKNRR